MINHTGEIINSKSSRNFPWTEAPGGLQSMRSLSQTRLRLHFHALAKAMATHSSVLAWRISGTGEPGGLPSLGSHRVGHDWSDLAAAAARNLCRGGGFTVHGIRRMMLAEPSVWKGILCSSEWQGIAVQVALFSWTEPDHANTSPSPLSEARSLSGPRWSGGRTVFRTPSLLLTPHLTPQGPSVHQLPQLPVSAQPFPWSRQVKSQ